MNLAQLSDVRAASPLSDADFLAFMAVGNALPNSPPLAYAPIFNALSASNDSVTADAKTKAIIGVFQQTLASLPTVTAGTVTSKDVTALQAIQYQKFNWELAGLDALPMQADLDALLAYQQAQTLQASIDAAAALAQQQQAALADLVAKGANLPDTIDGLMTAQQAQVVSPALPGEAVE